MPFHPLRSVSRLRSRWVWAIPLAATLAVILSCGGDAAAPTPPPPPPPPPPAPQPTTVSVTPTEVQLTVGDSAQLAVEVRDQNGQVMAGVTVRWASSDAAVATVTSAGLVHGASAGSATVTATAGQASGSAAVTVSPPPPRPTAVSVTPAEVGLTVGDSAQLAAEVRDQNGEVMTGVAVAWASSDAAVATVTSAGLVHGASVGATTITATAGQASGNAEITVSTTGPRDDRAALVALYEATNGPGWREKTNWLTDAPIGQWHGATTDSDGAVISLDLSANGLAGNLPPEIGDLANINQLWLGTNLLSGPIPPELANLANLEELWLDNNQLAGNIPLELGNIANLTTLRLDSNRLAGNIPSELGNLGNLTLLRLDSNQLAGNIPPELGNLANLINLGLENNRLTGAMTVTLLRLDNLERFHFDENAGLCAPGTTAFVAWLASISDATGDYCNRQDRAALEALYKSTGGANWSDSDGWLAEGPILGEWYGIGIDSIGRAVRIDLAGNGLAGRLPTELGQLTELRDLRIGDNPRLTGPLPLSLTSLALTDLHYAGTGLCSVDSRPFRDWLATITSHDGTGRECTSTDREVLVAFYHATGGTAWTNSANWLTDAPIGQWYGATTDSDSAVISLDLSANGLAGSLPPEIGDLANINQLWLGTNQLSGPIPPELGNLANLEALGLDNNQLDGNIPPELGNLANLALLRFDSNQLDGNIPPELGNLANLALLRFDSNQLAGNIPPELGNLANLAYLWLDDNRLDGNIPPELGGLANLAYLSLSSNDLDGSVPAEFGNLAKLEKLGVSNNPEMEGALPASLTNLGKLTEFLAGGTALCAPSDPAFLEWLDGLREHRIRRCEGVGGSAAYLTQAVQSLAFPVPLVAGEPALLRVFVSSSGASGERMPPVRARFYLGGSEVGVANIPAPSAPIPTSLNEGDPQASANALIPASVVQRGLEMVIEIDPDSTLDASLGIPRRIPAEGRAAAGVRVAPELDFTIVPLLWREAPDMEIVRLTTGLTADNVALLWAINTLLPVRGIDLKIHEPVVTSSNNVYSLLAETAAIRTLEGAASDGYYMGMMSGNVAGGFAGLAYAPGRAGFSIPDPGTIAHELGHNFSLNHAPCGGPANVDPDFPVRDGTIGAWGFDMRGNSLVAPHASDLMSYCFPQWISDYQFTKAYAYRAYEEAPVGAGAMAAGPERVLLLWGGVGEGGEPFLEPAFIADAPPSLPLSPGGQYTVAGHDDAGGALFSLSFAMPVVPDGDGRSSFAYALPVRQEWAGSLASITLSGPAGSFTLDGSSDRAAAILRDPLTGQVRGIFRDAPPSLMAAAGNAAPLGRAAAAAVSLPPGLEVLASRGLPRPEDWKR